MSVASKIKKELLNLSSEKKAKILSSFFKTGKGQYGEEDIFIGVMMPKQREIARKYLSKTSLHHILILLKSKIHECRMTALIILVMKYQDGDDNVREEIFKIYLENTKHINNWDLVDVTCRDIVGEYVYRQKKSDILFDLAKSQNLWEKRISVVSTWYLIKYGRYKETMKVVEILMNDKHDLIHKACGWMLREVGKKDEAVLIDFLEKHKGEMPRTMLRYAVERLSPTKREAMLG